MSPSLEAQNFPLLNSLINANTSGTLLVSGACCCFRRDQSCGSGFQVRYKPDLFRAYKRCEEMPVSRLCLGRYSQNEVCFPWPYFPCDVNSVLNRFLLSVGYRCVAYTCNAHGPCLSCKLHQNHQTTSPQSPVFLPLLRMQNFLVTLLIFHL